MADQKQPPAQQPSKLVNDLLGDLDSFSKTIDMEAAELARQVEAEKQRKEEARRAAEAAAAEAEAARRRAESNMTASVPSASPKRGGAMDLLRKQATTSAPKEDPAVVKARNMSALNQTMRSADRYLAEFILAIKTQQPACAQPYPFLHLGQLQNIVLSDGYVDSRPKRIEGVDYMAYVVMRFRINANPPGKQVLHQADMAHFEQYLKGMGAAYEVKPVQKNDFGQTLRAEYLIKAGPTSEVVIEANYNSFEVQFDLRNVRQLGRRQARVPLAEMEDAPDELARYILGADDDFAKRLTPA